MYTSSDSVQNDSAVRQLPLEAVRSFYIAGFHGRKFHPVGEDILERLASMGNIPPQQSMEACQIVPHLSLNPL